MKHLLSIDDLSTDEVQQLFETAADMHDVQNREVKKLPALRGRTVVNMFFEDSTRTRSSFEIAGKWLSADVINVSAKGSSTSKGESLREYTVGYGLTRDRLALLKPDVPICHPGPMNRGLEIAADAADAAQSVVLEQVSSGLAIRMAVLYHLLAGEEA